jgi:hypothetical protein
MHKSTIVHGKVQFNVIYGRDACTIAPDQSTNELASVWHFTCPGINLALDTENITGTYTSATAVLKDVQARSSDSGSARRCAGQHGWSCSTGT